MMTLRPQHRTLLPAIYPIAGLMVLVPGLEILSHALPPRATDVAWRFGLLGSSLAVLITPMLGVTTALLVAGQLEDQRVLVIVSSIATAMALLLLPVMVFFLFDYVQLRASLEANQRAVLDFAAARAFLTGGLSMPALLFLALRGRRAAAQIGAIAYRQRESSPLVFRHEKQVSA